MKREFARPGGRKRSIAEHSRTRLAVLKIRYVPTWSQTFTSGVASSRARGEQ
jgi:hypothetical protein